jgi:hypothetical protein
MDPWWTDPKTGEPDAQPVGPKTVTVNILPDALPRKPKRRRSSTVVVSKPFQEPPYWLAVDEPAAPARSPIEPNKPIEEAPFQFTAPAAPRKRRPIRSAIRVVVPSFISVSCAGLIVALTLQAMNPVRPTEAQPVLVAAKPPAAELSVVAKPQAVETPVVIAAEPPAPVLAKPQAAMATIVVEPPAAEVAIVVEPPAPVMAKPPAVVVKPAADCAACKEPDSGPKQDTYGTSIHFVENTKVAGEEAKERKKLMLVLNISGNFEDSGFT